MSHELFYTSAPSGLQPGTRGFCTVAATRGMSKMLLEKLEALSGYRVVNPQDAAQNPVAFNHYQITAGGAPYHVLSRIAFAGFDYSQRTNKLAHHLALKTNELPLGGPAVVLSGKGVMAKEWQGEPRLIDAPRPLPAGEMPLAICQRWQKYGDAGWAGVAAQALLTGKPVVSLFNAGQAMLPLIAEVFSLLTPPQRWQFSFSTYLADLPTGVKCDWKCCLAGSPLGEKERKNPANLVLDLTKPLGGASALAATLGAEELVEIARTGARAAPKAAMRNAASITSQTKSAVKPAAKRTRGDELTVLQDAPERSWDDAELADEEVAPRERTNRRQTREPARAEQSSFWKWLALLLLFLLFLLLAGDRIYVWQEKEEKERQAQEKAKERQAQEKANADRAEADRKAQEDADAKAAKEVADRAEAERKAKEEADAKAAKEKEDADRAEAERKAKEEAERAEAERKAQEEAERAETARKAKEEADVKAAKEEDADKKRTFELTLDLKENIDADKAVKIIKISGAENASTNSKEKGLMLTFDQLPADRNTLNIVFAANINSTNVNNVKTIKESLQTNSGIDAKDSPLCQKLAELAKKWQDARKSVRDKGENEKFSLADAIKNLVNEKEFLREEKNKIDEINKSINEAKDIIKESNETVNYEERQRLQKDKKEARQRLNNFCKEWKIDISSVKNNDDTIALKLKEQYDFKIKKIGDATTAAAELNVFCQSISEAQDAYNANPLTVKIEVAVNNRKTGNVETNTVIAVLRLALTVELPAEK